MFACADQAFRGIVLIVNQWHMEWTNQFRLDGIAGKEILPTPEHNTNQAISSSLFLQIEETQIHSKAGPLGVLPCVSSS